MIPEDPRQARDPLVEQAMMIARKHDEKEAALAMHKTRITVFGGAIMGAVGIAVVLFGSWRENLSLVIIGATLGLVSFGIITIAQAGKLFGRE